ncbi:baseplate J/gp47 family protein [Burkholderia pseudomallei]|uniref:baseplate J/gp47 family protein n=1 Tax=Burkholderia pseudomallei TaxID=28450 RepID=UPI000975B6E9|nr:baseplate J/gp47 family protein [Burkholderia pseudomallei]OMQ57067.1 phage baseplate protein [Burkholderia pseudomallei]OMQ72864.1 phage baseplate protein [Burkholderia pseudomallei]CAJ2713192.1 baseplate J family protein [Burkholderia pseudomallei]VBX79363.1 baseplate J family protein [Burkholderia pseudomallei]VBX79386.1 baseplate J family protein [Burkholderia pseudomallei]
MPFARPSLSDLRTQVASDIAASVPGSDPLLRIGNLKVTGTAQAGLAHLHYGYIDYIAKQAVPWTATDEYLAGWGALKNTYLKAATPATGSVTFSGSSGTIPAGTQVVRGDGVTYTTNADATVSGSSVTVAVTATTAGANGNCDSGTALTLGTAITGIQSGGTAAGAFTGGADVETQSAFGSRVMAAFQASPQGGAQADYKNWALAVSGVTRAWVAPNGFGTGTVVVYFMMDVSEAAHNGFPQGINGVSQYDQGPGGVPRGVVATGDQLAVANYIINLQPVTALVYACAPIQNTVNFTLTGTSSWNATTRSAVSAAISGVFLANGSPGGTINMSDIESAIGAVSGTAGFVITSPVGNITNATGNLPVLGTVTFNP